MAFKKAVRTNLKARLGFYGPAGSGKSWWSLVCAYMLGARVAVIDSERGSASKLQGETDPETGITFDFDVSELDNHSPQRYVQEIQLAEREGYEVIVVDSLSHAWMGREGALEQVDKHSKRSSSGNSYMAWREVTPHHNALVDALLMSSAHIIVTMRAKTEYVVEDQQRNGRTVKVPKKIGLAPVQREGLEYEFDVVGDLDQAHSLSVTKSRCRALDGAVIAAAPGAFATTYRTWLLQGSSGLVAPSAPRVEYDPGSEPGAEAERERAEREQRRPAESQRRVTRSRHLRPPARARDNGAPAPRFSTQATWPGAAQWSGKPLTEADLGTLLEYSRHVHLAAVASEGTPKAELLRRHMAAVESAIIAVSPAVDTSTGDPWGLAGNPTCDPCPANPECPNYERCLAAENAADAARESEAAG